VSTDFDHNIRLRSQRLADLQSRRAELENELSDTQISLDYELSRLTYGDDAEPQQDEDGWYELDEPGGGDDGSAGAADGLAGPADAGEPASHPGPTGDEAGPAGRTEVLVSQGRRSAYAPGVSRRVKVAAGAALAAVAVAILVIVLSGGGAGWPASVATVQGEVTQACRNPDVVSEPGQVNFACAKDTRQILWVFALVASGDNPRYSDTQTGRIGLEPITPAQGEEVAWSLNLHHPYRPANPVDSLAVAARAINNIIGGATVTSANGSPVVQPGLLSHAANCLRYTGSARLTTRAGFPSLCTRPVTSPSGRAALVADVYRKWVVGGSAKQAQDAAVLFRNAKDPSKSQVRAILRSLSGTSASA
jgi:hypothetical protein